MLTRDLFAIANLLVYVYCVVACVSVSRSFCRCRQGYRGPGTDCTEINPCMEPHRGHCHPQVRNVAADSPLIAH